MKFKKPSVAASVIVYAKDDEAVLLIKRKMSPFINHYAFPGGFLDVDKEDIYETSVRELFEETGIKVKKSKLQLVDVRSHPKRDPRKHVLDIGFFTVINKKRSVLECDETQPEWININDIDNLMLAFDHKEYWQNAKKIMKLNFPTST